MPRAPSLDGPASEPRQGNKLTGPREGSASRLRVPATRSRPGRADNLGRAPHEAVHRWDPEEKPRYGSTAFDSVKQTESPRAMGPGPVPKDGRSRGPRNSRAARRARSRHLSTVAKAVWGPTSELGKHWGAQRHDELDAGATDDILKALAVHDRSNEEARKCVGYIETNRSRMRYPELHAMQGEDDAA